MKFWSLLFFNLLLFLNHCDAQLSSKNELVSQNLGRIYLLQKGITACSFETGSIPVYLETIEELKSSNFPTDANIVIGLFINNTFGKDSFNSYINKLDLSIEEKLICKLWIYQYSHSLIEIKEIIDTDKTGLLKNPAIMLLQTETWLQNKKHVPKSESYTFQQKIKEYLETTSDNWEKVYYNLALLDLQNKNTTLDTAMINITISYWEKAPNLFHPEKWYHTLNSKSNEPNIKHIKAWHDSSSKQNITFKFFDIFYQNNKIPNKFNTQNFQTAIQHLYENAKNDLEKYTIANLVLATSTENGINKHRDGLFLSSLFLGINYDQDFLQRYQKSLSLEKSSRYFKESIDTSKLHTIGLMNLEDVKPLLVLFHKDPIKGFATWTYLTSYIQLITHENKLLGNYQKTPTMHDVNSFSSWLKFLSSEPFYYTVTDHYIYQKIKPKDDIELIQQHKELLLATNKYPNAQARMNQILEHLSSNKGLISKEKYSEITMLYFHYLTRLLILFPTYSAEEAAARFSIFCLDSNKHQFLLQIDKNTATAIKSEATKMKDNYPQQNIQDWFQILQEQQ